MEWGTYIAMRKADFVGKKCIYAGDNNVYTIVDVDHNGALMIDKPARYTETTAVDAYSVQLID